MQDADKETDLYVNVQVATKQQRNHASAYPHASDLPINQQVATQPQPIRMRQTCSSTSKSQPSFEPTLYSKWKFKIAEYI